MATATKEKITGSAETRQDVDVFLIDLQNIVSNTAQSRGMGALPTLHQMGYGLFEELPEHGDKMPIWKMLMSTQPAERKVACELIQSNEGHIIDKAESMAGGKQLQNIVVVETTKGKYDVIAGMLRCIALAYNYAMDVKEPRVVSAKLMGKMKPVDMVFMALDENDCREDEGPIDKAITYKRLTKEFNLKSDEIGKRQGRSGQSIRDHIKLLDPLLSDKINDINTRKMSIDAALKRLAKLKGTGDSAEKEDGAGERARMHSVKKLIAAFGAKKKPEWMDQKEWEMFVKEDVRKWLAKRLALKYKEFKGELVSEEPEEAEAPAPKPKAAAKKTESTNGTGPFKIGVPRGLAVKLLTALSIEGAAEATDEVLKAKLESIVNIADDDTVLENKNQQDLLSKLLTNYSRGIVVTIKAPVA